MATLDQQLDRGLPANIDAERVVLGSILLDNHACNEAAEHLRPEDFYLDAHRRIFQRMLGLSENSKPIDAVTLTEELGRHKEIESVGGVAYISSLMDGVPHMPSIEEYVKIVKDKALLRTLIHTANTAIGRAMDSSDSAQEVLEGTEAAVFQITEQKIGAGFIALPKIVKDSFGSLDQLYKRGQAITGLATHFTMLDEMTSGLQKSDLVIIAARPSMGKTALAINIAENAAVIDHKVVGIFSLEMSKESLLTRMLCSQARVDSHKMRQGFLAREDMTKLEAALDRLLQAPLFIDDTPGISLTEMRAKARRLKQAQGRLDLIVVDYLQLMTAVGGRRYENRTQEVSAISRGLKGLAKELKVPVIALSQLSRAPEARTGNQRPQLSDLRESGAIEQDADVVGFIFREEVYKPEEIELKGKAELILAKQRNGPTGRIHLAFLHSSTRFENLAEDMSSREEY